MVSIKVSNSGIPPILAATLRSVLASALLWAYARLKGERVLLERADLTYGLVLGVLFGFDFLFLYWGTVFTDASRAVIFLYTTPLWVALAAHFVLPHDRLNIQKGLGLLSAFLGLATVFGARSQTLGSHYWVGDLMEVYGRDILGFNNHLREEIHPRPAYHSFPDLVRTTFLRDPSPGRRLMDVRNTSVNQTDAARCRRVRCIRHWWWLFSVISFGSG